MSILIKGFPLPNNCGACPLRLAWCRERIYMVNRPERCPLIPVPPHRDLIDREYAIATACSGRIRTLQTTEDGEDWIRVKEVRESIKNAPTIIEAEEGEG